MNMKRKFLAVLIALLAMCSLAFVACNKSNGADGGNDGQIANENRVVLADFEQWAPDFQIMRLMESFGAVDVNADENFVKSGKQSAKLYVTGSEVSADNPYIYLPTKSEYLGFDYTDFRKVETVTAQVYSCAEESITVEMGVVVAINGIKDKDVQRAYSKTYTLSAGWNELVYTPDISYIATMAGFETFDGVKGVYFAFPKSGATIKADADIYYLDDVIINYGDTEKTIEKVTLSKDDAATVYKAGNAITKLLDTAMPITDFENKAIYFEFKLVSDGKMTFYFGNGNHAGIIGGFITVTKNGDSVTASTGRVFPINGEDGWYAWTKNRAEWTGTPLNTAGADTTIKYFLTGSASNLTTDVRIDWTSVKAVDCMYESTRDDVANKYPANAGWTAKPFNGIAMSEFGGKAIAFDFKMETDGAMQFYVQASGDGGAKSVIGRIQIAKKDETLTAKTVTSYTNKDTYVLGDDVGRITPIDGADNWYTFTFNRELWHGSGVGSASADDLVNNFIIDYTTTNVSVDGRSFRVADAYDLTRNEAARTYSGPAEINFTPIAFSDFDGKAFRFEFRMENGGNIRFYVRAKSGTDYKSVIGFVTITKSGDAFTCKNDSGKDIGKVVPIEDDDGWFAYILNRGDWHGSNLSETLDTYTVEKMVISSVESSIKIAVNRFSAYTPTRDERATYYDASSKVEKFITRIPLSDFDGKAVHFEFKPMGSGTMQFYFSDSDNGSITGVVTIKSDNNGTTTDKGTLTESGDGWFGLDIKRVECNGSGFNSTPHPEKLNYFTTFTTFNLPVLIDWDSVSAVETSRREVVFDVTTATKSNPVSYISLSALDGKAIHFEFKPTGEGTFGFYFADGSVNGGLTGTSSQITKDASGIRVSGGNGRLIALDDGWYAFELNRSDWNGSAFNNGTPTKVTYFTTFSQFSLTFILDVNSVKVVDSF